MKISLPYRIETDQTLPKIRMKFKTAAIPLITALAFALLSSCITNSKLDKENYAALAHDNNRELNPVIVIPGILGSRLVSNDDKIVWGAYGYGAIRHGSASGRRTMALPMRENAKLSTLTDNVRQNGTLDRLILSPGIGVKAYQGLLQALAIGGYREEKKESSAETEEHISCFQFGYDWRRSNAESAAALDLFIKDKAKFIRNERKRRGLPEREVKFDIVAHSMGGLVARYYMMYGSAPLPKDGKKAKITWAGTENVRRLVQVATPNNGSALAIQQLKDGLQLSKFLTKFQPVILGTLPSIYELLPRVTDNPLIDKSEKSLDHFDPKVWEDKQWGLANPSQDKYLKQLLPDIEDQKERRKIALEHLRKSLVSAKVFQNAIDQPHTLPDGIEIHAFIGNTTPTASQFQTSPDNSLSLSANQLGDDTVTVRSALAETAPDHTGNIQWTSIHKINATHSNIPVQPDFIRMLLKLLLNLEE